MLDADDRSRVTAAFGADDLQVRRDHLVSHLLAGLAALAPPETVFFGGTALARTSLRAGRLSEDIDLYTARRREVARTLTDAWPRAVRREYPRLQWEPRLDSVNDLEPALLRSPDDGIAIRVQLITADATYQRWPVELAAIEPRYRDVPIVHLPVPTRAAFVAMKASAWRDRHAPRDLFDLALLADDGAVDEAAVALLREVTGTALARSDLARLPRSLAWESQLGHQTRLEVTAEECLGTVRAAWAAAAGWH